MRMRQQHREAAHARKSPMAEEQQPPSKLALVTGSTSGIGLGIARELVKRGHDVLLHGLGTPEVVQSAIRTCRQVLPGFILP